MANTPQSKKRARQNEARYAVNKARRSRIRTFLRKVEEAIASGDQAAATAALKAAQPELARGVTKGVMHKNTVARKMSRLSSRVKSLATPDTANPCRFRTYRAYLQGCVLLLFRCPHQHSVRRLCADVAEQPHLGFGFDRHPESREMFGCGAALTSC